MKLLSLFSVTCFSAMLIATSCKKKQENNCVPPVKKIQFWLYTDRDFSEYNGNITFTASIRKATNQVVWDSVLPSMKIKDVPNFSNKVVIEKILRDNDSSLLKVGFLYSIEDVGISWFWDEIRPCETFKKVDFNFQ